MHSTVTKFILSRLVVVSRFKNNNINLIKTRNYESIDHSNSNGIQNRTVLFILQEQQKSTMGTIQELQPLITVYKKQ